MPWSEWILSPVDDRARGPVRSAATASQGQSDPLPVPGDAEVQISEAISEVIAGADATTEMNFGTINAETQQVWAPFFLGGPDTAAQAQAIWAIHWYGFNDGENRQMFPAELDDLEYGVDYAPRPDRDETTDPDAYIEYEDGLILLQPGDVQGWDGEVNLTASASKDGTTPWNSSGRASLRDDLPRPAALPPDILSSPTLPGFGNGITVAEVAGPTGSTGFGAFTMPAGTTDFAVVIEPDFTFPHDEGLYDSFISNTRTIHVRLLYPRWRYWKPGILPLRQYPRNDGLRGGAPSAKPTSRQGSTARRTYL